MLASGMVDAKADLRGIDQAFNFFAVPGPATCFAGVTSLQPGQYLRIQLPVGNRPAKIERKYYWQIDFPDQGHEEHGRDPKTLVDEFERVLLGAVERRLRADVPVVSYLSGGIDSSIVVAMAAKIRGTPIPTFTIQIMDPKLDETSQAAVVSRHIGSTPVVVQVGDAEVLRKLSGADPRRRSARSSTQSAPPSCGLPARCTSMATRSHSPAKAPMNGSPAMPGSRCIACSACSIGCPASPPSYWLRRLAHAHHGRSPRRRPAIQPHPRNARQLHRLPRHLRHHGPCRACDSIARRRCDALRDYHPYLELEPNFERMKRWHPLNRAFFWSGRIHLAGHLDVEQGGPGGHEFVGRDALSVPR